MTNKCMKLKFHQKMKKKKMTDFSSLQKILIPALSVACRHFWPRTVNVKNLRVKVEFQSKQNALKTTVSIFTPGVTKKKKEKKMNKNFTLNMSCICLSWFCLHIGCYCLYNLPLNYYYLIGLFDLT